MRGRIFFLLPSLIRRYACLNAIHCCSKNFHQIFHSFILLQLTSTFFFYKSNSSSSFLFVIAFFSHARHSPHDFADRHTEAQILGSGIKTEGQDDTRIFGRMLVTTGWTVMQVSVPVVEFGRGLPSLGLLIYTQDKYTVQSRGFPFIGHRLL